ncbi:MAG: M20 family metallopeptidase [Candidatus Bathyarchaeia archaeon]
MERFVEQIDRWISDNSVRALEFLQEMIRTPSPSGEEEELGKLVASRMDEWGYDTSTTDDLGDAMGVIKGDSHGQSLLMNGHIDHVPVGEMVDPYSAKIIDGARVGVEGKVVYGRAASDMKGAVASMVMAGVALREMGLEIGGDYKVAAVAQEEVGGRGTISTIEDSNFLGDVVIIGEATDMDLALGHRGTIKFSVLVRGRSCHASAPERGVNALYSAMRMINRIREDLEPKLPDHPLYDPTSLVVTQIDVKPKALNVVPEECRFYIDCRNTPNYPAEELKRDLEEIADELGEEDPEFEAFVIPDPVLKGQRGFTGFYTDPEKFPVVREVEDAMTDAMGRSPERKTWTFATDGRFYSWLGYPVIGFGPGEERFAHTTMDHVKVEDYLETIKVYASIAARICGVK